ncbi:MAG: gamma-glutamyl-gamma-aminobutyrate hydrolase family protein, partial [Solirubrobacterales bacterium]|nr:gamma-glutamyl-gamma-aminobutyrate hydrolase family protein [Solirubrobacterales bacterium]
SHHHQGVERIGDGFEVTGYSTLDELPEAIEAPARRFVLGVQWHPEADERSRVIAALVREARGYRNGRGSE